MAAPGSVGAAFAEHSRAAPDLARISHHGAGRAGLQPRPSGSPLRASKRGEKSGLAVCPWIRKRESEEEPPTPKTEVGATLAVAGGKPSDAAVVRKHGPADGGSAGAGRIGREEGKQAGRRRDETERCLRGRLKWDISSLLRMWRSQRWLLFGPSESLGRERMRQTTVRDAVGCTLDCGQEAKTEILVNMVLEPFLFSSLEKSKRRKRRCLQNRRIQ